MTTAPLKGNCRAVMAQVRSVSYPSPQIMLLLLLATEAPFNFLRPSTEDIDELIDWLVNRDPNSFVHILARTLLHRLNWESYLNKENDEPFLPLSMHLKLAVGLAKLSEKRILHGARFLHIQNHPVVEQFLSSTKSTASTATGLLLTTLGYRRLSMEPPPNEESDVDHQSRQRSRLPFMSNARRSSVTTRSRSQGPMDQVELSSVSDPVVSWCIDLVTRLHLPGCAINLSNKPLMNEAKTELMEVWQKLVHCNFDRNPITAFLLLSIHSALFTSTTDPTIPCEAHATGHEPPATGCSNPDPVDNIPNARKSAIALFWPSLRQSRSNTAHLEPSFSWWIVTIMHAVDLEMQSTSPSDLEKADDTATALSSAWFRLSPVISRHLDELIVNAPKSLKSGSSEGCLPARFVILLERLLLEAGLLSPSMETTDNPMSISIFGRVQVILSQLALTQSISLLVACPPENPVFPILLHLLLSSVFSSPGQALPEGTTQLNVPQWPHNLGFYPEKLLANIPPATMKLFLVLV
ncbi:unnamed protein product [Echinostoma caproni]|uniref:Rif1_N domain-containing protein n=1 Tax=Echinostoma caproni TaxID=27848 RepID=A0A183B271_9TREM|nr:unnamed protein product [Echinostoma caproni]